MQSASDPNSFDTNQRIQLLFFFTFEHDLVQFNQNSGLFLSGKEGSVYYGICPSTRRVQGLVVDKKDKDEFRQGVDGVMTKLVPPLLEGMYQVTFSEVLAPEFLTSAEQKLVKDTYVIGKLLGLCFLCLFLDVGCWRFAFIFHITIMPSD